jgi:hypothetical protein
MSIQPTQTTGGSLKCMVGLALLGCVGMTANTKFGGLGSPPRERKCALPGCNRMHYHNGGYCCAEHCREHRSRLKANDKLTDAGTQASK